MTQAPSNESAPAPGRTDARGGNQERPKHSSTSTDGKGQLPQFLKDLIGSPPQHGQGVHQWLFKCSRQLHAHRDFQTIVDLLAAACDGCGRHVPESEIIAAVESAKLCAWAPNGSGTPITSKPVSKWPALNEAARQAAIESAGMDVATLWDRSPVTMGEMDAEWFVDQLFPGNPLLCCGHDMARFNTAPRESFRGRLSEMSLIVPSAMSALTGRRKADGKESSHTLANTGPRQYLVTEFDSGTPDQQSAILWHLRNFAPLVMVLSSGGKSLHGWWSCEGVSEEQTARFFRYAVSLGADPATWTRSQFVRLPQGLRADKQRRQDVLWFDLEAVRKGGEA